MFEHKSKRLASKKQFRHRLLKAGSFSILIFLISLFAGIIGYHLSADFNWVDSFLNASMILGGMGPVGDLPNNTSKIFAGFYALFSGVAFISSMAIFITPILHRFLHKFHLDEDEIRGM